MVIYLSCPLFLVTECYYLNLECFVEDLFLGGQWSIILGYRRLSVKSLLVYPRFFGTIIIWMKAKGNG